MDVQLGLSDIPLEKCYFKPLLEDNDFYCRDFNPEQKNEVFSCDNPKTLEILSHIRGVCFDVVAKPTPDISFPKFIPCIPNGSKYLIQNLELPFAAVSLSHIVSPKKLILAFNLAERIGVTTKTKILVMSYARDALIEDIWPVRQDLFTSLSKQDIACITAINYSVWFADPHAEKIINQKRSLLTFEEMQKAKLPAIPMIYWIGKKDLDRWIDWLKFNPTVKTVALNLQTEKEEDFWQNTLKDLEYFVNRLPFPVHFLITGPKTLIRIKQVIKIFHSFSLITTYPFMQAACGNLLRIAGDDIVKEHSTDPKNIILKNNIELYKKILQESV